VSDATILVGAERGPGQDDDEPGGPARPTPDFLPPQEPEPEPEPGEDEPGGPARPTPDFLPPSESPDTESLRR
jgi:hypothetical protein